MRLNHHGNSKVQRFQLFEEIKKADCVPSPTMPHFPLLVKMTSLWKSYNYAVKFYLHS